MLAGKKTSPIMLSAPRPPHHVAEVIDEFGGTVRSLPYLQVATFAPSPAKKKLSQSARLKVFHGSLLFQALSMFRGFVPLKSTRPANSVHFGICCSLLP